MDLIWPLRYFGFVFIWFSGGRSDFLAGFGNGCRTMLALLLYALEEEAGLPLAPLGECTAAWAGEDLWPGDCHLPPLDWAT